MSTGVATKPSGIPWLGEVPAHWEVKRLKHLARKPIKNGAGEAADHEDPEWPRYIRITDIAGPRTLNPDSFRSLPPAIAREAVVEKNDLLLAAVGATYGKSYFHTDASKPACYAGYLVRFSPGRSVVPEFMAYWTESASYWDQLRSQVIQSTIQNFSSGRYQELVVLVPPLPEQRAIAAFLDERTARIDELLARKRRLVQLLKEKRQALITRAVTRGLDAKVKLMESGVPWLGVVPEHWGVKRLKHISEFITSGSRGWAEHYADDGAVFIRIGNLDRTSIDLRLDDIQRVDPPTSAEVIRTRALPGDLLISITAFLGTVGLVPDGLGDAYVNQHTALIRLQHSLCYPRFVAYWFASRAAQQQFESASQGGTKEGMNLQEVRDLITLQPSYAEQKQIADALDASLGKLDALVTTVEAAMERLQEYRTALISAAVTGKVHVPM